MPLEMDPNDRERDASDQIESAGAPADSADSAESTDEVSAEEDFASDWDATLAWMGRRWRLVILVATALLLAVACRDMHFNPDSIHYVDVARTMLQERTVGTWHLTLDTRRLPETLLYWPPVYPALLAGLLGIGLSVQAAAWLVSVASYTAAAWILSFWLHRAALVIVAIIAFIHISFLAGAPFRAWSEGPYMPLMLGSLVCIAYAVAARSSRRALLLGLAAGVIAGLTMLTRYTGITIVPALIAAALLVPRSGDDEKAGSFRLKALIASLIGMAAVVTPWLARNFVLNQRLMGPERPPGERPFTELITWFGFSVYADFGAILLALIVAAVGYHALRRHEREGGERSGFLAALVGAGVVCGLAHIVFTLLTFMLWEIDEPPTKRYFLPAYLSILMAGMAMMARARLPENVLGRRAEIIVLLALPLVIAPIFVGAAARDVTPPYTELDAWIEENTAENDLIVAHRGWPIRFYTGRPVLQSGQAADPPITDGERVAEFLERFGDRFGDVYVIVGTSRAELLLEHWRAAGVHTEEVETIITRSHEYDAPRHREIEVHRVLRE